MRVVTQVEYESMSHQLEKIMADDLPQYIWTAETALNCDVCGASVGKAMRLIEGEAGKTLIDKDHAGNTIIRPASPRSSAFDICADCLKRAVAELTAAERSDADRGE